MHEFHQLSRKELMRLIGALLEEHEQKNEQIRQVIDETAVNLANAAYLNLVSLNENIPLTPAQKDELTAALVLIQSLSSELVGLMNALTPVELKTVGLQPALENLCQRAAQGAGYSVVHTFESDWHSDNQTQVAVMLYRLTERLFAFLDTLDQVDHVNLALHRNEVDQIVWQAIVLFTEQCQEDKLLVRSEPIPKEQRLLQAALIRMQHSGFAVKIAPDKENKIWTINLVHP